MFVWVAFAVCLAEQSGCVLCTGSIRERQTGSGGGELIRPSAQRALTTYSQQSAADRRYVENVLNLHIHRLLIKR